MHAKCGRGLTVALKQWGGGNRHTDYETIVRYNTAKNVSNVGGDPVTQLIVNLYQMIKL